VDCLTAPMMYICTGLLYQKSLSVCLSSPDSNQAF